MRPAIVVLFVIALRFALGAHTVDIESGDQSIILSVSDGAAICYSVHMDGKIVIPESKLDIELEDGSRISKNAKIVSVERETGDETWHNVVGNRSQINNKYNQAKIVLESANGKRYLLICRACNNGVAFRYAFDDTFGKDIAIRQEHTEFAFEHDFTCWPAYLNHYQTEHQALYPQETLSAILPEDIIGVPLTIRLSEGLYCSIMEAALTDWAGMYLTREGVSKPLAQSKAIIHGGNPHAFRATLPAGTRKIRIVIDAAGDNAHDHVDIVNAAFVTNDGAKIWLSDLQPVLTRQEWGQLRKDKSVDGNPLQMAGKQYDKGLGTHSNGVIVYKMPQDCVAIEGAVGIDDEVQQEGKAAFKLYAVRDTGKNEQIIFTSTLSRRDDAAPAVRVKTPHVSPWRVIMLGRKPVDLVNSDLILNLNEPSKIADTSWIQPGVSSWNWLSCGSGMDMNLLKSFIDLSASMGWEYTLIDDGWYKNSNCIQPIDGLDMLQLVEYAAAKHVRIWLWVHWQALNARMEEAFSLYERWGIAGIKTDFMSRDDQWMVNWYHQVLASAARHRLMVNFHGCYKPTGIRRTWPNLMTREAVFGEEQNLGSQQNDPVHKTTLPFTRMLAGPMDYTPGSMLNETREGWSARRPVKTLGTRAQEFALCVIYDNPVLSMADKPDNYYGQRGLEFLKDLPTSWDDTRVLDGQIGQYILTGRRKADIWYLGAITNWNARRLQVHFDFLGAGRWNMMIYEDGPDAGTNARDIQSREISVTAQDVLTVEMAPGGGFTAILRKAE